MKGLIFRYFSLLLLFLVIGVNLFGSEDSKGNILVSDKENIEKASEEFQISTTPFDQHGVFQVGKLLIMEVGNNSPSRSIGKQNLRHVEVNSG